MIISILTVLPDMFQGPFDVSILKRAQEKHLVDIRIINIRDFATDRHKSVDDHPYGGGHGMLMRVDVLDRTISSVKKNSKLETRNTHTVLLDPQGTQYTQKKAQKLSTFDHLILVCGHYEGVDERVRNLVDEEISIGDYVLTGGEIPAMVIVDSIVRLVPGVLTREAAHQEESFSLHPDLLEHPQYTRPFAYKSVSVPSTLVSGDHQKISTWKTKQATKNTQKKRPDLLKKKRLKAQMD